MVLQRHGTFPAADGQSNVVLVRAVRVELHALLCHLFFGPDQQKMWRLLRSRHGLDGGDDEAPELADAEPDPDASASRQAAAEREFRRDVLSRLGITAEPVGRQMVCHRDMPGFQEGAPGPRVQVQVYHRSTPQPLQPRCLCYSCINVLHLFRSNASKNAKTGRTKVQQWSRKRRHGFPPY